MRIVVTSVFVADQAAALAFYTDVLGFLKKTDIPLGGGASWLTVVSPENVDGVEWIAETRVRVGVRDDSLVDVEALQRAGLAGAVQVAPHAWHLVAGLEAEQYAEGMRRRLASA